MTGKAILIAAVVLLAVTVAGPSTAAYSPAPGAVFNNPYGASAAQDRIVAHVREAVQNAPAGSTIRFAAYSFDRKDVADALLAAHDRGVHVQMVVNDNVISDQTLRIQGIIGKDPNSDSFVVICHGSCRGGPGNLHSKFYLFTQTGDASDVVMVGSANLANAAAVVHFNDLYTVNNAPDMLSLYTSVFDQLKLDHRVANPYVTGTTGIYRSLFYPHPGTTRANDPVMQRLNAVRCAATGGTGANGHTVIRIEMYAWTGTRGKYIADKVVSLKRHGCNIRVILSRGGHVVAQTLRQAGIGVRTADVDTNHNGVLEHFTHEKLMTLSGTFENKATRVVWTGSENWADISTQNDEVVLRVPLASAYADYIQQFNSVWSGHSHAIGARYGY
jgi:phosphatidylserine/phosphatidylglycerophosphate/cardiolipin synthase-like enzyme